MGRAAIAKAKVLILREAKRVERPLSKISAVGGADDDHKRSRRRSDEDVKFDSSSSCWVPHPKSGIYFPKGHEWVMNDVPDGAASLGPTFWLRSLDGVDKPDTADYHDDHPVAARRHY